MNVFARLRLVICILIIVALTGCSGSSSAPSTVSGPSRAASVLQQDVAIANEPDDESQSAIAYNTQADNYLVVWARTNNPDTSKDIIGKVCTGSDSTVQGNSDNQTSVNCGPEFDIAVDVGTTQENPKVAYSPSQNKYLVVWQDTRNVNYSQIYGQFVNGAGQVITKAGAPGLENFAISTHVDGVDQSQTKPEIIYNHVKNKFVTAWVDKSTYDSANVVTLSGSGCVNDIDISYVPPSAADNNIIRTKEIDPALGGLSATDHASELVFTQVFGDDGSKITAAWRAQINETSPKVVVDQSGTNIIAWSGQNNDITMELGYTKDADTGVCTYKSPVYKTTNTDSTKNKIKIRRKDLNLVKDYSFGNNVASIAMGINGAQNKLLLAWEDNTETGLKPLDIKGQLFDLTSFTTYGPVLDIAVAVGNQSSPAVAFDPANERFFVTWDDGRNESDNISNMDVYGQFIDKTGNLSGGNTIVTMEPGNQGTPQVAFGDTDFRKFFVVWNDGRNPATADIYGQMIEFSTYPQLVVADEAGVAILNGAIDFGTVNVGSTKDIKLKIKNDGNSQLYISDVSTPDAPYSFATVKPTTVSPGTYADLIVRFSPMAAGSYSGAPGNNFKVVLKSNGGQATLYFSGTGSGNQPVEITTSSLANGSPNATYPQKVEARYGVYPYTWSLVQGTVPTGLTFTSQGAFTGTIGGATSGVFNFTVRVTDSEGASAERALSISVSALSISTTSLKSWTVNRDYAAAPAQSLQAAGGTGVFAWTADGLPNGLSIDPDTGSITGVPTVPGSFPATFSVSSGGQTVTKSLTISINQAVVMTQTTFPTGVVNESYLHRLALQGGTAPFTWTLVSAPLPPGISFDSAAAEFAGTPTQPGTWSFVVKATDASGATTGNQTLSITVNPALDIQEAAGPIDNATAGTPYSFSFHPGGGRGPFKWAIQGNGLPSGLELNADTGKVTGTPVNSGEYSFTVAVTDSGNNTVAKTFTINVQDPLQSQSASVDFGDVAASLTKKLSVTIINGGVSEITVTDATTDNAAFAVSNKPSSLKLAQNQTSTIDVVFSPAADQAYSGKLLVKSSGGDLSIPLTGTGVPQPVIAVSSSQVGLGQVPSNSQKTSTFTISNTGLAPLTVTAINGATSPFSLDVATPFILAPGATQDVGVTVVATDTGALSRKLTIVSDAVNVINPIDVTATAVGNIAFVVDGVQKSSLIFGNVFAGTSSPAKTVSVRNNGSGAVTLASAAFNTGDGFKSSFNAPQTLAAGKTYLFTVTFTPQEDEPYEDTLILKDDVNTQFQLAMTGNGMPVAVALPGVTQAVVASTVPLEPEDLPNEAKPVGFVASEGVDFTLTGAGPNETVEVEVTFANEEIPEDAVFYKIMPDSSWVLLSQVAGNYTRTGNTIRFTIQNDSSLDWDKTNPGVIRDPIVVGRVSGSGTGTGAPSSGGGGGGCFIATAAFGSYLDPHVMVLRNFRDNVLLQTGPGTAFVTFYYKYSPPVADFIRDHESLRIMTRWLLTPLIVSVKYPLAAMAFGLLLMSAGIYRLRRKERIAAAVVMENGR